MILFPDNQYMTADEVVNIKKEPIAVDLEIHSKISQQGVPCKFVHLEFVLLGFCIAPKKL